MEQSKLPKPEKRLHKLLIWAYRSIFENEESVETSRRIRGRSPLDIPSKSIIYSCLAALVVVIVVGNIFFWITYALIGWCDLPRIEKKSKTIKVEKNQSYAIVDVLIPQWNNQIRDSDSIVRKNLQMAFPDGKITVHSIASFIQCSDNKNQKIDERKLRRDIIGRLTYNPFSLHGFLVVPGLKPQPPDEIADIYNLKKSYEQSSDKIDSKTWQRFIVISAIQHIRDKLDNGVNHPRRLLFALTGIIQWLTFWAAVWCLILLLMFRGPWSRLQLYLATENHLPWHSDQENVWDIRTSYLSDLDEKANYPGMFVTVRLIKDVLNVTKSDKSASIYQVVRERIEAYRNSVEIGEYEIINFLIWATPTFGFLGTIFGIISAMENAAAIFAAPTAIEQGIALDKVSVSLGVAFDTSFIALVWLIPMSYFLARVRKSEANLFEELEYEAIAHLPPQIEKIRLEEEKKLANDKIANTGTQ